MVTTRVLDVAQHIFTHEFHSVGAKLRDSQVVSSKAQSLKVHNSNPLSITWISDENEYGASHYWTKVEIDGVIYKVSATVFGLRILTHMF